MKVHEYNGWEYWWSDADKKWQASPIDQEQVAVQADSAQAILHHIDRMTAPTAGMIIMNLRQQLKRN